MNGGNSESDRTDARTAAERLTHDETASRPAFSTADVETPNAAGRPEGEGA